ncbi:hypothetical protein EYC59_01595 [Candidatus Saccharibacteria bacterium]|nr:MAG: hypothetical protein EYC59_01595 [Candidatus Saccharibacteria bacterium]
MAISKKIAAVLVLSVLATSAVSSPVLAHNGSHDEDEPHTTTTSQTTSIEDKVKARASSSDDTQADDKLKADFQNRAKQQVEDLKKNAKQKTQAARQTACNERKNGAEQRITSISTNTARFQTKLDSIFTKVQAYKTDKNLTVENYDTLVAAVTSAQSASADSIAALKGLQPTIDCTKDTNAQNVAAFRTAAQDSRDKLKAYMKSLKELLKAVRDAKQSTQTQTKTENEGSTN